MIKRLLALLVPAGIVGGALAAGGYARKAEMIDLSVWVYLWPWLVAVAFAALAVGLLMIGLKKWSIPPAVGFIVQVIGILMYWLKAGGFDDPWDILRISIPTASLSLLMIGILWLVVTLRSRWLEQKMLQGVGGDGGVDQQELAKIRKGMSEAMDLLRRAGRGRNALYELPWFLVMGRSQGGKTIAIKNSGLSLPVRKDWVKGVGGTVTCNWFFTPEMIFLDTPGSWVKDGADEKLATFWQELLRLLRRYRGRQPLDGLIVVVPADDLLGKSQEDLRDQVSNIREVIDQIQKNLSFRLPVYLLISKCDLVEGFVDFFKGLPAQRRNEILGWSNEDPNSGDPRQLVSSGFRRLVSLLEGYRLEMLARVGRVKQARRLFFFTEEFRRMAGPLRTVADILFMEDPASEPPVFRGFYFTSGTQGEGSPLGSALSDLAQNLGVRVGAIRETQEEEPKRSYFLLELFRSLMVGDEGLVDRTAVHWWRRRRDTMMVAFLPAGVAVLGLFFSILSYALNVGVYGKIEREVPQIAKTLAGYSNEATGDSIGKALDETERLYEFNKNLAGFTMVRGFGMRRPEPLLGNTLDLFREQFTKTVLGPTLQMARVIAADPNEDCATRLDVFYGVILLSKGEYVAPAGDMEGLQKTWGGIGRVQADEAGSKLVKQFSYLKQNSRVDENYLGKFDLAGTAKSIKENCSADASLSAFKQYLGVQQECATRLRGCEITDCYDKLEKALKFKVKEFGRMRKHIEELKRDLQVLEGKQEPGAKGALASFNGINLGESEESECTRDFNTSILQDLTEYFGQVKNIDDCHTEWKDSNKKGATATKFLNTLEKAQKKDVDEYTRRITTFNRKCQGDLAGRIDAATFFRIVREYRRAACMEKDVACSEIDSRQGRGEGKADRDPDDSEEVAPVRPRPAPAQRQANLEFLEGGPRPRHTSAGWATQKAEWSATLADASEVGGDEGDEMVENVDREISTYTQEYLTAWQRYLKSIRLKPGSLPAPTLLDGLGSTNDYKSLFEPVRAAMQAGSEDREAPFNALRLKLEGLGIEQFVGQDLKDYQRRLKEIAEDLKQCTEVPARWRSYLADVNSSKSPNNLVDAIRSTENAAGPSLAGGDLLYLLIEPLSQARSFLQSESLIKTQWDALTSLHAQIASGFPFAGDPTASAADRDKVIELLGCKGLVRDLRSATGLGLPAPALKWLDEADGISRALFGEGTTCLDAVKVKITIQEITYDPEDLKGYKFTEMQMLLGPNADTKWDEEKGRELSALLDLFGETPSEASRVKLKVNERKGMLARALPGGDWKPLATVPAANVEGAWAPLKLLQAGLPENSKPGAADDALNLVYSVPVPDKEKVKGFVKLHLRVSSKGLGRLIKLMKEGLPPPPPLAGGD